MRGIVNAGQETVDHVIPKSRGGSDVDPADVIIWLSDRGVTCDCEAAQLAGQPVALVAQVLSIEPELSNLLEQVSNLEPGDFRAFEKSIKPAAVQIKRSLEGLRVWSNVEWGI